MSVVKTGLLVLYAILIALMVTQAGTTAAAVAQWLLVALAVAHLIEVLVYFKLCQQAGGSLALQLLNVFLFGVVQVRTIQRTVGN